jgi:hypothetical protein
VNPTLLILAVLIAIATLSALALTGSFIVAIVGLALAGGVLRGAALVGKGPTQ